MATTELLTNDKPSGPRSRKGVETRVVWSWQPSKCSRTTAFWKHESPNIAERAGLSHGSFDLLLRVEGRGLS